MGRQIHSIQTSLYIFRSNVDCRDVTYDLCTTASKARFARIKQLVTQGRGSLVRQTNKSGNKRLQDNCAKEQSTPRHIEKNSLRWRESVFSCRIAFKIQQLLLPMMMQLLLLHLLLQQVHQFQQLTHHLLPL